MNMTSKPAPSTDRVIALVRGELSPQKRWAYRILLVGTSGWLAAVIALWFTEPGPLPTRLTVAFATFAVIGAGWISVLIWVLTRRNCPGASDRIATSWMALIACILFLVVAVPITIQRGDLLAVLTISMLGVAFVTAAGLLLRNAYTIRAALRARLAELEAAGAS